MAVCSSIYRTNPTRHPPTTVALGFCRKSGLLGFGQMNLVVDDPSSTALLFPLTIISFSL
ncbi:hypothetical protein Hanom_Chr01g00023181 [Helianthus anomalus]